MKPNILFVFSDQHRKHDLGCYGNPEVATPNLDRLAQQGIRFEHCISNDPVCVPARGCILTGLYPQRHKAFTNDLSIDTSCTSIADVLNQAGYHTGYYGKWHLCGIPRDQFITKERRLGFQEWKVANCNHNYLNCYYDDEENQRHYVEGYESEIFGDLALDFIERNSQNTENTPWALFLSFASPHGPHKIIDQRYLDPYRDKEVSLRPNVTEPIMVSKKKYLNIEQEKEEIRGYYGHITAIDKQMGFLVEKLTELGQLENTIILYTSDHGDMLGSHGVMDKQTPYEEAVGVPLIAYWKGHTYAGVSEELIGLVDLPVTLAGLAGLCFQKETDGKNLQNIFTDKNAKGRDCCYMFDLYPCHQAYQKGYSAWRAIRTKEYTYAVKPEEKNWLLFDNTADPYQMNNLVNDPRYETIKAELWEILQRQIEENDHLVDGDTYIRMSDKWEEFNRSQEHFGFPVITCLK